MNDRCGTLLGRRAVKSAGQHVKLSTQVVHHEHREEPSLVGREVPAEDAVHLGLRLQPHEVPLLGAAAVVKCEHVASPERHTGKDGREVKRYASTSASTDARRSS